MEKKNQVRRMFDTISGKYDFLNHFLSAGIDIYWRKKALKLSSINKDSKLLDVACGTGDFSIEASKFGVSRIFGADLSLNMLKIFARKKSWSKGRIVQCVAELIPFKNNTFTHVTVAFGVRNFYNIGEGFKSFFNILQFSGQAIILEFRLPANKFLKAVYLFYFNKVLPFIGRIISKDKEAYTYLPESVGDFDKNVNLEKLLKETGFKEVKSYALTFGIVQVVIATK